jgi:hypothetical protein
MIGARRDLKPGPVNPQISLTLLAVTGHPMAMSVQFVLATNN